MVSALSRERMVYEALVLGVRDYVLKNGFRGVVLGLSGGIDSSLVCALLQSASPRPIKTFTMGFEERVFDEAVHARRIAEHLGCDHSEMYVGEKDLLSAVDRLRLSSLVSSSFFLPAQGLPAAAIRLMISSGTRMPGTLFFM